MVSDEEDKRTGETIQGDRSIPRGHSNEPVYHSCDLLWGGSTARIDHGAERYTLRVTRQGKLILTK